MAQFSFVRNEINSNLICRNSQKHMECRFLDFGCCNPLDKKKHNSGTPSAGHHIVTLMDIQRAIYNANLNQNDLLECKVLYKHSPVYRTSFDTFQLDYYSSDCS